MGGFAALLSAYSFGLRHFYLIFYKLWACLELFDQLTYTENIQKFVIGTARKLRSESRRISHAG